MPKIKVKGQTVQTGECPQQTHTDATKRIISPVYTVDKNKTNNDAMIVSRFFPQCATCTTHDVHILMFIVEQNLVGCSSFGCYIIAILEYSMEPTNIMSDPQKPKHVTTPSQKDQAMATGNMHKKLGEIWLCGF